VTDSPESPEIDELRRLLADARHTEPMPADVVARMDDVIAGLRDASPERETPVTPAPADRDRTVVPLAAHRRRRAAGLLVAAATIVVGGVVTAQHLAESSSSSGSTADAGAAQNAVPRRSPDSRSSQGPGSDLASGDDATSSRRPVVKQGRLVVHPKRFSVDALVGRKLLKRNTPTSSVTRNDARCGSVPAGDGEVLGATYRRAPAALVYRTSSGGSQVVDLYVCGSHRPIRSATLPAP
jgi:hypothetical protein